MPDNHPGGFIGRHEKWLFILAAVCVLLALLFAALPRWIDLTPLPAGMLYGDIYWFSETESPRAVLVLAPVYNNRDGAMVADPAWREFAREHQLALAEIAFASDLEDLHNGNGYYYVRRGSGQLLLRQIEKHFPGRLPLLAYGFSGGAHFTARLAEWCPERLIGWCAYAAGWWDDPREIAEPPPGVIIAGTRDSRYQSCADYFAQGRRLGRRWFRADLEGVGHQIAPGVEAFVRDYFAALLDPAQPQGVWLDIESGNAGSPEEPGSGWLPGPALADAWRRLNPEKTEEDSL